MTDTAYPAPLTQILVDQAEAEAALLAFEPEYPAYADRGALYVAAKKYVAATEARSQYLR